MNGHPFKKSKSLLIKGLSLKGKNLLLKSNLLLSFKSRPCLRKASLSKETKSQKLFPLFKMAGEVPYKSGLPWIYMHKYSSLYRKICLLQQSERVRFAYMASHFTIYYVKIDILYVISDILYRI